MTDSSTSYGIVGTASGFLGDVQQAKDNRVRAPEIDVAGSHSDFGTLCCAVGEFQEAKDCYGRALEIRLKKLGPEHVDVAGSYDDLGTVCGVLGEFQQAKEYHSHALDIRWKKLGLEHDKVARSYSGLGNACCALGELQRANDYHFHALKIRGTNLGPNHVDVAGSYSDLGNVFHACDEFQRAKDYCGRALDILLKNLGPEHVKVAGAYSDLGTVCRDLGELQLGKDFYGRTQNIRLMELGPEHVDVAGLVNVFYDCGEFQQTKDYCGPALEDRLKYVGIKDVKLAGFYRDLETVFCGLGKLQQAKDYYGIYYQNIRLKGLGPEHVDVACAHGELQQAKEYYGRALAIRLKNLGWNHDLVALSYCYLGTVCTSLGDFVEAKDNFRLALNILAQRSGPENIIVAECYRNLANICDVIGIPKLAKDWNERVQTILRKNNRTERADVPSLSKFQTVHSVPPYIMARGSTAKAAYQRALETGKTFDKRAKILLIGQDRVGKTSVARSLKGELFRQDESSTVGVQIDMPLKHVSEKPWKNSKEEQEKSTFYYKCALNISNQLLTEPPSQIYVDSEVTKQTETDETQITEEMIGEIRSNPEISSEIGPKSSPKGKQDHDLEPRTRVNSDKISPITQGDNGHDEKRNSDMPDEVVRLTTENLSRIESVKDDGIWPVCMDFGGQAIYRAIHPILASREAVYLLMVDPTKDLSALAQCLVKEPGYDEVKIPSPDKNDTNLDHIMRWMDMVNSFKHEKNGEVLPPVILVGTHADLVQGDPEIVITSVKDIICDTAREFSEHIIGKTFAVNNTLAGKELEEEDPQVVALRKEILKVADTLPHTKVEVPLKWLQVENEVCNLASRGENYVTRQDFRKNICDEICKFEVEDDYEVLLHFLHDRGTVVYHGRAEDPGSVVFLNPKWLIDVLCQIITVEKQKEEKTPISNLRKDLGKYGILDAKLLDYSCKQLGIGDIKESLLFLMKKFNLLCEYMGKDGGSVYLVPCMLTSTPDDASMPDVSAEPGPAAVYVTFTTQYVPGGLFSRMVVLFLECLQRRIAPDLPKLWANFARFFVGDHTAVDFVCSKRVIKVHVWNYTDSSMNPVVTEPRVCSEVFSFLKTILKRLHEECHWLQTVSWDLCARCDLCWPQFARGTGECYRHAKAGCRHDDCAHYVSLTKKPFVCSLTLSSKVCPPKTWSQVLDDTYGKNYSGKSVQSFAQTKDFDRPETNQGRESFIREEVSLAGKILKGGILCSDDHAELSNVISKDWRKLGLLLGVLEEDLDNIDNRRHDYFDKAHQMLRQWKQQNASNATYLFLYQALCHKCLNRRDLAERFCFH